MLCISVPTQWMQPFAIENIRLRKFRQVARTSSATARDRASASARDTTSVSHLTYPLPPHQSVI